MLEEKKHIFQHSCKDKINSKMQFADFTIVPYTGQNHILNNVKAIVSMPVQFFTFLISQCP